MKRKCDNRVENIARKGKLLVISNFSFSQCFHSYISLVRQNAALCGNGLRVFNQFMKKRENAGTQNFSFPHSVSALS